MLTGFELGYFAVAGGMLGRARHVVSTYRTCHDVRGCQDWGNQPPDSTGGRCSPGRWMA